MDDFQASAQPGVVYVTGAGEVKAQLTGATAYELAVLTNGKQVRVRAPRPPLSARRFRRGPR